MKKIRLLDICYPDYFRDHSNTVYGVYLYPGITVKEVIDLLDSETALIELNEYSGFTYDELNEAFEVLKKENEENMDKVFTEIETSDLDDDCSIYAYFTLEEME